MAGTGAARTTGPSKDHVSECVEFDDILELVGSRGTYQKFLLYVVLCPIITVQPIFTMNALFMLYQPNHWCRVPGRENETDIDMWKNLTIPREKGADGKFGFSKCSMYDMNNRSNIIQCQNGWEYDRSDFDVTIPSQYDWVCDKDQYATDALTLNAVGNCIGNVIFGWSADKFGRKPIFFITIFINTFFRGVSLFVPQNIAWFLLVQMIVGIAYPMMYIIPSMIVAELSATDYRGWIYAVTWMIWVIGMMCLPLIAWLARNWFIIGILTSAPGVLLMIYYWILPESPRWLLSVGKVKESARVIEKMATWNGTVDKLVSGDLEAQLKKIMVRINQKNANMKSGFWTLFKKRRMGLNTVLVTVAWSMNGLIYYGVTMHSSNMAGNQFLNFFLLAAIELPSGYLGGILVDRTGRRWTQVAFFIAGAIAFILAAIGVSSTGLNGMVITAVIVGKFCVTLTFLVVYLQAAEVFPTELRSTGNGFASTVAAAVQVGAPYLAFLGKYMAAGPYLALAAISVVGLMSSAFLPETLNQSLPETIEDANKFGEGDNFWSYLPTERKRSCSPRNKL